MARPALPILMYHKVGFPHRSPADRQLNVPAKRFRQHMRLLARLGFHGVTLSDGLEILHQPTPRGRPVVITFDDGFECVAHAAAPVLKQHGWPATVFVSSAFVGQVPQWPGIEAWSAEAIMDATTLRHLQAQGWEIAAHTRSHADLAMLDDNEAQHEISDGKHELEAALDQTVQSFAYPYGRFNERTPALVRDSGLRCAVTTRSGVARYGTDPFLLPRVKVASRDGAALFLYRLLLRPYLPA